MPDETGLMKLETNLPMNETEWIEYIRPIQQQIDEIRKKYGEAPKDSIYTRLGPGGDSLDYVREEFFVEILNDHFPDWSFFITHTGNVGQLIYVTGRLILNFKGVKRIFDDTGEDRIEFQDNGKPVPGAVKSATTDCFKRCCHRALGAAQNVYNLKDIERKQSIARVKNAIEWIEYILGDPEPAITTEQYTRLQSAHEYFKEKEANLPTEKNGWNLLFDNIKKLGKLKEVIDAERARRD